MKREIDMKKKYIAITIGGKQCVTEIDDAMSILETLRTQLEKLHDGYSFTVAVVEMIPEKFEALDEFEGWE